MFSVCLRLWSMYKSPVFIPFGYPDIEGSWTVKMRRHLYFQAYNLPNIAHLGCPPRCWHVGNDVLVISRTFHWYIPASHMIMYTDKQNSDFQSNNFPVFWRQFFVVMGSSAREKVLISLLDTDHVMKRFQSLACRVGIRQSDDCSLLDTWLTSV